VYDCQIILADAGSTDHTRDTARLIASRLNLLNFQIIDGGLPAVGRNAGAKLAKARYVLFLDADVHLRSYTLIERTVQEMRAKGLHCATTDIFCPRGNWKSKLVYHINNFYQRGSRFFGTPFSTGMCMFFDRKVFDALGGFREDALFAEDYMLSKQVKGSRFRVIPGGVETSDRRMQKMGYWKLAKLFFTTALFSHRDSQFTKDHGYWKS
jgi:glycosyltransferase involved in cell wall biosynthesis